jgi:cell wall-associated NlpC family hydrolase
VATARRARLRAFTIRPAKSVPALAVVATLVALVGPASTTQAAPQLTINQVEQRVHELNEQAEVITESYNLARERLTQLRRQQTVAAHQLKRESARLAGLRTTISATADAAYRGSGSLGGFILGGTDDPETFLDQAVLLDALSRSQATQFAEAAAAGHAVEAAKVTYDAKAKVVRASLERISAQRAHIEDLLAQAHDLLSQLRADQRDRLAAQQAAEASAATAMRGSYTGPASGRAAAAVQFAYDQLGKPYVYGAAGPSSYDCSGLTMAAWGAAGVSLPHNAAAQQSMTHAVSSPAPGDLVFFGSPAGHVGIYVGNGNMIAAPHTGDVVKVQAVYSGVSGYGRP